MHGGNAVDAAVAMVAAQGVVAPETCGLGGDLFAIIHMDGEESPYALNASGRSGSNAFANTLRELGAETVPGDHPLAVTIPGCVDGLTALSERFGSMSLDTSLAPAIALATEGFRSSNEQSNAFAAMAHRYVGNPAVSSFYPGGAPIGPGQVVMRPRLASTLREIASGGRDAFYAGVAGEDIVNSLDGHVTMEDLGRSQAEWIEPMGVGVGDDFAWFSPPNSAGYLGPGTLAVFVRLDPPDDPDDPLWWHLLIEAHRALAWERDRLVSDPSTAEVPPSELLSDDRLDEAAASVSVDRAGSWPTKPAAASGTAYMCVGDNKGLSVSIINSNYHGTGSPFGAARSGFLLHDRGRGFSLEPGHPNELLPGKRPGHTLSPTLWTRGSHTSWLLGTRGGEIQPQLIAQLAARAIVGGQPLESAQAAPRWSMTQYGPGSTSAISLEPGANVADQLRSLGHEVGEMQNLQSGWGPMSIIDRRTSELAAAADPRVDTTAAFVF